MKRTSAARRRQRPHLRTLGWWGAAALLAIGLLPGAVVGGAAASNGPPTPVAGGHPQAEADPTPTPTPTPTPEATPTPTPTPQATPTPTPSPTPEPTPTPDPTPTPTPAPTPTAPFGYWEGTAIVGDEATGVAITLGTCADGPCGEITLPEGHGVGCSYNLWRIDPDDEGVFLPAEPPLAEDQLVYEVGSGCIDCSDTWLDSTTIYVRPLSDGSLEVTPVDWLDLVPIFSLAPAPLPTPQAAMDVSVDTTTLVRGQPVTVTVSGFLAVFVYLEQSTAQEVPLGPVDLDERGSGTLVARVPGDAPLGQAEVFADGVGLDRCENGAIVRVTVVAAPGSNDAALPTPPATDTATRSAAHRTEAWRTVLTGLAALVAGILVLVSRPGRTPRRGQTGP